MFRPYRALLALTFVLVVSAGVPAAFAQQAATQEKPAVVWINPVKGAAEIHYLAPVIKVDKDGTIVTTFQVKNMSTAPIARLQIEEFWYDSKGNPVSGDKQFLKKPLQPQEIGTIVLHTPKNPNMNTNSYKFSHQYGDIKPKKVTKF